MKNLLILLLLPLTVLAQSGRFALPRTAISGAKLLPKTGTATPGRKPLGFTITSASGSAATGFTLSASAVTSAGVYQGNVLRRTLWSNEPTPAGTVNLGSVWDGLDDAGAELPNGNYTIKAIASNVTYDWLRPIGNTSEEASGGTKHRAFGPFTAMVQAGNTMYYGFGYSETAPVHLRFEIGRPNKVTTTLHGGGQFIKFLASDGNIVYSAGERDQQTTFITGIVPNPNGTDALASFSAGTPYSMATGSPYVYSAFDITGNSHYITGLAVMQSGQYLFATHKTLNELRVYNKTSGALVRTISSLTTPREVAVSGSNLWVISATNTVTRHTINSDGTLSGATLTLTGLNDPVGIAVSPDGSKVAVSDGGTFFQVKLFSTNTGALVQTIGRAETYDNPRVFDDKFYFKDVRQFFNATTNKAIDSFVTFQSDGSLWIRDAGNLRMQHFAADGTYIDNIQFTGFTYSCQVDPNSPTRVFSNYLEFEVNYADNSWVYVRNWSKNITRQTDYDGDMMRSVATLSNGRTYALYNLLPSGQPKEVIELDIATGIRHTGVLLDNFNCDLNPDGSQWRIGTNQVGQPTFWSRRPLTGFDGSNNPVWGAAVTLETTPPVLATDPLTGDGYLRRLQQTSTGVIATFSSDKSNGYHVGGFKNGQWMFRASPSTRPDYEGDFPADGTFDIANQVNVAGSFMQVVDRSIFWGYNGEFWKGSQTNMYNHYLDNGLMVGQFGHWKGFTTRHRDPALESQPGDAGNANAGTYVKVGADIHFFHADENVHSGVHHWKIGNLSSIREYAVDVVKAGIPTLPPLPYVDLMAGLPASGVLAAGGAGRWSFVQAPQNNEQGFWEGKLGQSTYRKVDRNIRFSLFPASIVLERSALCDLRVTPGVDNNLTTWRIEGQLMYPEVAEGSGNNLEILDNTGKVIVQVSRPETFPRIAVRANSTNIIFDFLDNVKRLFVTSQPFSIRRMGSKLLVSYGPYPEVSVTALESGANLSAPTTLRVRLDSPDGRGHRTDLAILRLYPN